MITPQDKKTLNGIEIKFTKLDLRSLEAIDLYRKLIRNINKQMAAFKFVVERQQTTPVIKKENFFAALTTEEWEARHEDDYIREMGDGETTPQ